MAFRFGFFEDSPLSSQHEQQEPLESNHSSTLVDFKFIPQFCQEALARHQQSTNPSPAHFLSWNPQTDVVHLEVPSTNNHNMDSKPNIVRYFSSSFLKRVLRHTALGEVDSDIIQGFYLGGLKCWSCTSDVVKTIFDLSARLRRVKHDGDDECDWIDQIVHHIHANDIAMRSVADIGCGLGLCGVAALKSNLLNSCRVRRGVREVGGRVFFHDFNEEIATMVVSGTLSLNLAMGREKDEKNNCDAASKESSSVGVDDAYQVAAGWGDWTKFHPVSRSDNEQPEPLLVDLIVAADVSYDDEASVKFLEIAERLLKPNKKGMLIVGTKAFYFGTNGGIDSLLKRSGSNADSKLKLLCQSPRIGGENDMLRYVLCFVKE